MKFGTYDKYIYSTGTHYISNSGHDENKKYTNGKAGDQTGDEWSLRSWYNRPWSVVLRYQKDPRVGILMANLSCAAALNNKIGYDQNQRGTYNTQLAKVGYDPSAITTACEEDCTAGVTANTRACGYILGISSLQKISTGTYSKTMKKNFVNAGFTALTDSKYLTSAKYLQPGDILLYEGHHAAANVTVGSSIKNSYTAASLSGVVVPITGTVSASTESTTTTTTTQEVKNAITVTAASVNLRKGPGTNYPSVAIAKLNEKYEKVETKDWTPIVVDNQVLWISSKYIK